VSSNVGIDFTELGPPPGQQPRWVLHTSPQRGRVVLGEKQEILITVGFVGQTEGKGIHSSLC
jgi:hypothetical protein